MTFIDIVYLLFEWLPPWFGFAFLAFFALTIFFIVLKLIAFVWDLLPIA